MSFPVRLPCFLLRLPILNCGIGLIRRLSECWVFLVPDRLPTVGRQGSLSWAFAFANGGPSRALTGHALEDRPRLQSWPVGRNSSCESTHGRSDRRSRLSCQLSTFPPSCLGNWFRTQEDQHLVPGTVVSIAHLSGSSYQQHPRKRPKSVRKKSLYKQTPP